MSLCPGLFMVLVFKVQKFFFFITKGLSLSWVCKTYFKPQRPGIGFFGICTMLQWTSPKAWMPRRASITGLKKINSEGKSVYQSKILPHLIVKIRTLGPPWPLTTNPSNVLIAFWTCVLNLVVFLYNWTQLSDLLKFSKHQIYCFWHTKWDRPLSPL